jgi:hypothetical protein
MIFWKIWFVTSCAAGISMKQRRWTLLLFPYSSPTLPYRNCHHYIFLSPLLMFAKKLMGGFSSTCRSWETHMEAAEETLALINTLLPMIGPQRLDFHATSIHPVAAPLAWCSLWDNASFFIHARRLHSYWILTASLPDPWSYIPQRQVQSWMARSLVGSPRADSECSIYWSTIDLI